MIGSIVWDKLHPVLTRKDFMGAFELAFYGWKEGAAHEYFGPNNATDLWHVKKVNPQSMVHLTEKPVELAARAMQYSSRKGENVLDLFGGSGSTLNLNRLIRAEEGNWSGSVINNRTRDEQWTLSPTGNFSRRKIDLNGDGDFVDTNEIDDTGTFNKANEWLTRDTDSNGSTNYTLTHDAVGQLTDDGKDYKYKYDGLGRLKEVKNQSNNLVAEYRYNGLGYRIAWHYDANASGAVDGSDPWYYFVYDERWRPVATYRGSDTSPKEQFVFHAAGKGGMGGSSYIDSVVLRDKDANTAWTSASDSTLEDRIYYCQNWRNDVSVLVKPDSGNGLEIVEWIKYSAYGVPYCIAAADYNRSGATDTADSTAFDTDFNNTNARADVNFDGTVDLADFFAFYNAHASAGSGGRNVASQAAVGNRIAYAGYQWEAGHGVYNVRHRVLAPALAQWLSRDPMRYQDSLDLYSYVANMPLLRSDASGQLSNKLQGGRQLSACTVAMRSGSAPAACDASDDSLPFLPSPPLPFRLLFFPEALVTCPLSNGPDGECKTDRTDATCDLGCSLTPDAAGYTCTGADGKRHCCVCSKRIQDDNPNAGPGGLAVIEGCVQVHEQQHRDNEKSSNQCCNELFAYMRSLQCLKNALTSQGNPKCMPGDVDCMVSVSVHIDFTNRMINYFLDSCFTGKPCNDPPI